MTEPTKKENESNLPLVGLGLVLAAAAGVAVGWFWHKATVKPETPTAKAAATQTADEPEAPAQTAASAPSVGGRDRGPAESAASAATATGSAGAPGAPALEGPCADYGARICEAAGEQSEQCRTVKAAAEMMPAAACEAALADIGTALAKIEQAKAACLELQTRLCKDIGEDTESCKLVKEQTPRFPAERCQSMLGQYDAVLKDLQRMENRNKPLDPAVVAKIATSGEPGSFGPADAKVVVVEFSNFLCPYCKMMAEAVEAHRDRYKGVVRFVYRQFPLASHGPTERLASAAALAANAQGKFWELHDLMYKNSDRLREEGRAAIEALAQQIGLDMNAFKAALDNNTFEAAIEADLALGEEAFVDGTPTMFINGKRANVNPRDPSSLAAAWDAALTEAGVPVPPAPAGPAAPAPAARPAPAAPRAPAPAPAPAAPAPAPAAPAAPATP
ncbi:MAG: thioredoxin domain-containing protein [Deltaproteobacteria bacterium]|nr:thioredoxin domain-containing protein [Deltaproteobacteria bacterium]